MTTYPLPSNVAQWIDEFGRPKPDLYRYMRQLDAAGATSGGFVRTTRALAAGAGLIGGGDLSADRSFAVGAGTGIQVNADSVEVKYGTVAGTAAQGNDARIVGAAQTADLGSAAFVATTAFDAAGAATAAIASHVAASDPHPQYLTAAEGNAAYQPLDSDLTAIAALASTGIARRTALNTWSVGSLVTYAEIQNVSVQYKLLGRVSSGVGPVEEIDIGTWATYTPTVSASSGTITSAFATGRYLKIGKLVVFQMAVAITTNGTGAGVVIASLPFNAAANSVFAGRANSVSGKMLQCTSSTGSTNLLIWNYDNTYPGANGETLLVSGFYETQ